MRMGNYLSKQNNGFNVMSRKDRSYGIQKIFYLHSQKLYKPETLFIATAIFDRYINILGVT